MKITKYWWILVLLVLALGMRLPLLSGSFWLDEAAQALESARPLTQQLDIPQDFQPPLLHLLVHFSMYVSHTEWWLRTIAALIPGLVTIWATFELGCYLGHKRVGILAALFLATSSFHIFYSQELRPYSLPAMWASLSWLLLIKLNQRQKIKPIYFRWYLVTTILGLYSSYLFPFLLLAQLAWMIFGQKKLITVASKSILAWSIAFLPWLPSFWTQLRVGQELRTQLPGWENVVSISQFKSLALVGGKFIFGVLDLQLSPWFLLTGTTLLLAIFILTTISWKKNLIKNQTLSIFLVWLVIPVATAWLTSFFVPVVRPKRLLMLLPAFYLSIAYLTTLFLDRTSQTNGWLKILAKSTLVLLLTINLYSTFQYYTQVSLQRENWRALYQKITVQYPQSKSVVVFSFPEPFAPWQWYDAKNYPTLSTGQYHVNQVENLGDQLKMITKYDYVLVFDYLRDLSDPNDQILQELRGFGYQEVGALDQNQIGFVRIYTRPNQLLGQNIIL